MGEATTSGTGSGSLPIIEDHQVTLGLGCLIFPTESDSIKDVKEGDAHKELKKKNNHHQQNQGHKHHQLRSPKSPHYYSDNMVHQNHRNNGLKSPLHQRGRGI
ncbi:hypothetical protein GBA52_022967 [Prunus armeniaca]|nr:hypothetical protein GBA52_022967 [Prunus armeniaca]